ALLERSKVDNRTLNFHQHMRARQSKCCCHQGVHGRGTPCAESVYVYCYPDSLLGVHGINPRNQDASFTRLIRYIFREYDTSTFFKDRLKGKTLHRGVVPVNSSHRNIGLRLRQPSVHGQLRRRYFQADLLQYPLDGSINLVDEQDFPVMKSDANCLAKIFFDAAERLKVVTDSLE